MDGSAVLGYVPNSLENRITIRGASRPDFTTLSKTATSEADNYILKLYNTRNLRLENIFFNAGNPAYSKGIELQRYTYNFELVGGAFSTATNSQTGSSNAALYSSGATLENCTMQFSTVENLAFGAYISGAQNQDISNTGVYIAGNILTGNYSGISLYHVESPQVLGNTISASRGYGISAGQGVADLSIQVNQISGSGQGGINLSNLGSGIHELINNFVSTAASAMYSIKVENSPSVKLYHNTIVNSSANANAAAFYQAASSPRLAFRNNIAVAANGYAAWFNLLVDINISTWDHNLYHSTGANIVRVGGSNINNTVDLDALVGGLDSIMADPLLIGGGFQISAASPAYNAGISLPFVIYDILGQVRDDQPDIGCYEYHFVPLSAPQNLQISLSPDQGEISLSWDSVAGAESYYVQSASDPYSEDWQNVPGASTVETTISFPVPDVQQRFYRVIATE
ncbi:MAG: right-handed parallel beta-helix repeat-containing protein [Candidatus Cloacimonadaceae bacterium]